MCPTDRTCKRNCFVVNELITIQRRMRSTPIARTSTLIDHVNRDSRRNKCPDGSFEQARARILGK